MSPETGSITLPGFDPVDGYACPIDPMDALQCDSCQ